MKYQTQKTMHKGPTEKMRERVRKYMAGHPDLSYREIGAHFDRSGAWVSWLLRDKPRSARNILDVIVTVHGGVCHPAELPAGVRLHVRDYDTDGSDERAKKDKDGDEYLEGTYILEDGEIVQG
jgi:hypothetical protein